MRIGTLALAAALCLLASAAWPASEIIANFVDLPVRTANGAPPSMAEARDVFVNAGATVPSRPWTLTDSGPGKLMARLQVGRKRTHVIVVEVAYSPEKYSIQYRNSVHMNYRESDKTIHTSYNVWVKELAAQIDQEFGALRPTGAASPAAAVATATLAAVAPAASAPVRTATPGMPQAGDTWTYRATLIRRRGESPIEKPVRTHVVTVESASDSEIVDQVAIDDGSPIVVKHTRGAYLVLQGVSIMSPYLGHWTDLSRPGSLGGVEILGGGCDNRYSCDASARVVGSENIRVAAGTFTTTRLEVKQSWAPQGFYSGSLGGRTITMWYAPDVKRVVKYSSRATVGAYAPIDPHFDVELVSYQLK